MGVLPFMSLPARPLQSRHLLRVVSPPPPPTSDRLPEPRREAPMRDAATMPAAVDSPDWRPADPAPGLLSELAEHSRRLESATPQEILAWTVQRFAPRLTMGTAFGPEGKLFNISIKKMKTKTEQEIYKDVNIYLIYFELFI